MTGVDLKKNPMHGFGLFGLAIFAIAIIGLLRCERDNPFDPNSSNFKAGAKPTASFSVDMVTCFVKDSVQFTVFYKDDSAKGGAVPSVKTLYFNWSGDRTKLTDSISVTGKDSFAVIKRSFTPLRDTFAYVWAKDNDGERSLPDSVRLIVKGEKVVITRVAASKDSVLAGDTVTLQVWAKDSGTSGAIQNFIWTINGVDSTSRDSVFKTVFNSPGNQIVFVKAQSSDSVFSTTATIKISVNTLVDSTLPVIEFISPDSTHDTIFSSKTVVTVQVKDPGGISLVLINGGTGAKMTDSTLNIWQDTVSLNEGPNQITVIAFDKSPLQNKTTKSIAVTYIKQDMAPPLVIFTLPRENDTVYQSPAGVVVSVTDPSGVAWVLCNGDTMVNTSGSSYTAYVALKEGKDSLMIKAEDKKGNAVADTLIFNYVIRDKTPPAVRTVSPHSGEQITAADVAVTVEAEDTGSFATGVDSVTIKGVRASFASGYFYRTIQLKHGYDTVRVVAWDASANHNVKRDSVVVIRNVSPRFVPDSIVRDTSLLVDSAAIIPLCAFDEDGDTMSFAFLYPPAPGSTTPQIAVTSGGCAAITGYKPQSAGLDTFSVIVTDAYKAVDTLRMRVHINFFDATKPYFTTDSSMIPKTAVAGKLYAVQLEATDPKGKKLAFSLDNTAPAGAKIDSTAKVTWIPSAADMGKKYFVAFVNNGSEGDTISWTVTVVMPDLPPHLKNPGNKTVNEMQSLTFTLSATDSNNDQLTYSFKSFLPPGAALDSASGVFNWTPTYQDAGVYPVVFKVSEKNRVPSLSDSVTDTITVINVNVPPVLVNPGNKTVNELQSLTFDLQASDVNRDLITFSIKGAPAGATIMNGKFAWAPTSLQGGIVYSITFYAADNGLPVMRDSATITITVLDATKPVFAAHTSLDTVYLGSTYLTSVKAVDSDGDSIIYSKISGPDGLAVTEKYGVITWKPATAGQTYDVSIGAADHAGNKDTISWKILVLPKWPRVFGNAATQDTGYSVVQTTDGGYALCGTIAAAGLKVPFFIRTDTMGNPLQYKTYNGPCASANSLQQTSDGGFIMCGTDSIIGQSSKLLLIKTNGNGDTIWTARLGETGGGTGGQSSEKGASVCLTSDGLYFLACGVTTTRLVVGQSTTISNKMYVVKVSIKNGTKAWDTAYSPKNGYATGYCIQPSTDNNGGFIVCGETSATQGPIGTASTDLYMVRCGSQGRVIWTQSIHHSNTIRNVGLSVVQASDGGFIVGGYTTAGTIPTGFVMKVNNAYGQDVFWTPSTDDNSAVLSVKATNSGDFAACGYTASGTYGGLDVLLHRFTANGQITLTKSQGGSLNDAGFSVCPTKGNGFVITGITTPAGSNGNTDIYLVKTDGQGGIVK